MTGEVAAPAIRGRSGEPRNAQRSGENDSEWIRMYRFHSDGASSDVICLAVRACVGMRRMTMAVRQY